MILKWACWLPSILSISSILHCSHAATLVLHDESFVPDWSLRVTYARKEIACRSQMVALVNGTAPGPQITLRENNTSWVRVYNDMETENLTIHWHGLSQSVAPFADGTPQASQWPIPAGYFFDYELRPTIGEAGTYFYHSHVSFQAVSVAGPLIVEEASGKPPYKYDAERIMFLSELYNKTNDQILGNLALPASPNSWSGDPETILVNGNSFPAWNASQSETPLPWQNYSGPAISSCKPEVIKVETDTTYRFRVIGGLALTLVSFAFEHHSDFKIIEADGSYTEPTSVHHIQIGAGQRLDFLLTTKSQKEIDTIGQRDFWIQFATMYRPVTVTSYAILRYTHSPKLHEAIPAEPPTKQPLTISPNGSNYLEYALRPLTANNFPAADKVTRTVYLKSAQLYGKEVFWSVNNHTWTEDDEHLGDTPVNSIAPNVGTPYLVSVYEHGQKAIPNYNDAVANGGYDAQRNVFVGKIGEVIDIVIYNQPNGYVGGFDAHPWHIHGGHIYDLGSGYGDYDAATNEAKLRANPPVLRDTTMLYKYTLSDDTSGVLPYSNQGWRAWRLNISVAGVWMIHCHSLQHMIAGMQTVWVMGNASEITANQEPYVKGYLKYGGSAYGNSSYDPLVLHYF